ncbi:MAG: DNA recombination protein RmuC [Bacilli bacterium]
MEIIILILLIINIILIMIMIIKLFFNKSDMKLLEANNNFIKEIGEFKFQLNKTIGDDFNKLNDRIDFKLNKMNEKVNERLDDGFMKTNKTFNLVVERLTKIDEAQKRIDKLGSDINILQEVLTDKKTRGIFGEVNLKNILTNVFGENNVKIYKMQHMFPNNTIVDCVLFAPSPLGTIGIDSKFPLENYRIMIDKTAEVYLRKEAEKSFKNDVKKHIDAIASKYIIDKVTSNQAIMFLPAEAIFAEITAYHPDILDYAYKKRVWITSPTTLISTLTIIQVILKNVERDKYTTVIHQELNKLGIEFSRYKERWSKLSRSIESVSRDAQAINITADKITKRFESVNDVDIEKLEQ